MVGVLFVYVFDFEDVHVCYSCGLGYSIFMVYLSYIYPIFIVYLWYVVDKE